MKFKVRNAKLDDLDSLVEFVIAEANEAEGIIKSSEIVLNGIKAGLENPEIARYWILEDENGNPVVNVSVVKEWIDWNCAFYWWIQSMFLLPNYRGIGLMEVLLKEVRLAAGNENAIELRLYVHKDNHRAIKAYKKVGFCNSDYNLMIWRL
jgi:GNAT superfamily N-acetyltransferase